MRFEGPRKRQRIRQPSNEKKRENPLLATRETGDDALEVFLFFFSLEGVFSLPQSRKRIKETKEQPPPHAFTSDFIVFLHAVSQIPVPRAPSPFSVFTPFRLNLFGS